MHSDCSNSRRKPRKLKSLINRAILALGLALPFAAALAAEFRTIGINGTVLYDAPSNRANKLFVTTASYPVEIISTDGAWARVRDVAGDLAWVERKALSERQSVLVSVPTVEARVQPDDRSVSAFQAAQGVVLEVVDTSAPGWLRVRHRDGLTGYVRIREIWGQ